MNNHEKTLTRLKSYQRKLIKAIEHSENMGDNEFANWVSEIVKVQQNIDFLEGGIAPLFEIYEDEKGNE